MEVWTRNTCIYFLLCFKFKLVSFDKEARHLDCFLSLAAHFVLFCFHWNRSSFLTHLSPNQPTREGCLLPWFTEAAAAGCRSVCHCARSRCPSPSSSRKWTRWTGVPCPSFPLITRRQSPRLLSRNCRPLDSSPPLPDRPSPLPTPIKGSHTSALFSHAHFHHKFHHSASRITTPMKPEPPPPFKIIADQICHRSIISSPLVSSPRFPSSSRWCHGKFSLTLAAGSASSGDL
jgi:hypothetical protein